MESLSNSNEINEARKRTLIIEHAQLVSSLASSDDLETRERISQIEEQLKLTSSEIAVIALQYYRDGYRG